MADEIQVNSTHDGLAAGAGACTDGITQFLAEDCTAVKARATFPAKIGVSTAEPELQDIKSYFERPRLVSSVTLTAGRGVKLAVDFNRSRLFGSDPSVVSGGIFPEGFQRLRGVYAIRFTLKFRLNIMATPFHQGLLCMSWEPDTFVSQFTRSSFPCAVTQLPHVRMDLAETSTCELEVPYIHRLEHYPINASANNTSTVGISYGYLAVTSLLSSPDVAGTARSTMKLYVSMKDVELIGYDCQKEQTFNLYAQAKGPVEREQEDARPLSGLATSLSKALRFIGRGVPAVSSVANVAAYISDGAAGALRAWGYSKPVVQTQVLQVTTGKDMGLYNVDVPVQTRVLSAFKHSHIPHSAELGGTEVDEMALDYVLGQYSQLCVGNLTSSFPEGDVVWACPVSPAAMWFQGSEAVAHTAVNKYPLASSDTYNAFYPTNIFYVCSPFKAWTGGFKFRFTFAKTKFHTGRVAVCFNPSNRESAYATNYVTNFLSVPTTVAIANNDVAGYTTVFDLRDTNMFEFEVPYIHERPVCSFWGSIGTISMHVVDPLIAPTTVAPALTYMVEVKAVPGFRPVSPNMIMYPTASDDNVLNLVAQAGGSTLYDEADQHVAGERFNSIKQLIMLPSTIRFLPGTTAGVLTTLPRWFTGATYSDPIPTDPTRTWFETWGSYYAHMYRYVKGGTAVTVTGVPNTLWTFYQPHVSDNTSNINATTGHCGVNYMGSSLIQSQQFGNAAALCSVTYPGHAYVKRVPVDLYDNVTYTYPGTSARIAEPTEGYMGSNIARIDYSSASSEVQLALCAADDAACGFFLGPMPLALVGTAARTAKPDAALGGALF